MFLGDVTPPRVGGGGNDDTAGAPWGGGWAAWGPPLSVLGGGSVGGSVPIIVALWLLPKMGVRVQMGEVSTEGTPPPQPP